MTTNKQKTEHGTHTQASTTQSSTRDSTLLVRENKEILRHGSGDEKREKIKKKNQMFYFVRQNRLRQRPNDALTTDRHRLFYANQSRTPVLRTKLSLFII